jgi:hypothetical protein
VEDCQSKESIESTMLTLYSDVCFYAKAEKLPIPYLENITPEGLLSRTLARWAELVAPKPLIVLLDEVDVLTGAPLIDFLRQLRGGFAVRGAGKFPISIALVGMRDLKDYITASKDGVAPNPGSPFNIKADSAVLANFSKEDITRLFAQRTAETGQQITQEALDYVWEQSKGQPWIVNNLFMRATMRVLDAESADTVTIDHVQQAREQMILARETHLDALAYRLEDPRIHSIMEMMLVGSVDLNLAQSEAYRLCLDLGLVTNSEGLPQIANPIYKEVLARQITYGTQMFIQPPECEWKLPDGSLNMDVLMCEFQQFWRENSEIWEQKSDYTEAFPHLLIMAFMQKILNGNGHIDREYAAGSGRMDLMLEYAGKRHIIEIKIVHDYETPDAVLKKGLVQIQKYRDKIGKETPSYLIIFDRRTKAKELSWDERIKWTRDEASGVEVLGG